MITPILPTYNRIDLVFERGEGAWLFTKDGQRYLDFTAGIAVNVLGHAHPHLVAALTEQAGKLWHLSNLFRIEGGERLAQRLIEATFADTMFFTNSGAEALECAIKMARRYQYVSGHPERNRIITFEGAFHGRTLATIAAGGNEKYLEGFGPAMPGFDQVPFGDIEAVKAAIGPETGAILVEPVQGEGGVRSPRGRSCARCASSATSTASCWCSTRCSPASAAPASCSRMNGPASPRTSWPSPRASAAASRSAPASPRKRRPRA